MNGDPRNERVAHRFFDGMSSGLRGVIQQRQSAFNQRSSSLKDATSTPHAADFKQAPIWQTLAKTLIKQFLGNSGMMTTLSTQKDCDSVSIETLGKRAARAFGLKSDKGLRNKGEAATKVRVEG